MHAGTLFYGAICISSKVISTCPAAKFRKKLTGASLQSMFNGWALHHDHRTCRWNGKCVLPSLCVNVLFTSRYQSSWGIWQIPIGVALELLDPAQSYVGKYSKESCWRLQRGGKVAKLDTVRLAWLAWERKIAGFLREMANFRRQRFSSRLVWSHGDRACFNHLESLGLLDLISRRFSSWEAPDDSEVIIRIYWFYSATQYI